MGLPDCFKDGSLMCDGCAGKGDFVDSLGEALFR
jgi:hypothetical protein